MELLSHLYPGPAEVSDEPCAGADLKKKEPPFFSPHKTQGVASFIICWALLGVNWSSIWLSLSIHHSNHEAWPEKRPGSKDEGVQGKPGPRWPGLPEDPSGPTTCQSGLQLGCPLVLSKYSW